MARTNPMPRPCTATARSGDRCRQVPIRGGNVCRFHGGSAPQVKKKARQRLAELVDPAIKRLRILVDEKKDKRVALAAARDILDRNDLIGTSRHELTGPGGGPIVTRIERVIVDPKEGDEDAG